MPKLDPYNNEYKKLVKRFLIYIGVMCLVFLVTSTLLSLLKFPVWAMVLFNVVLGGGLIFLFEIIRIKRKDKKEQEDITNNKVDPFA